jgi:hypothetical protein
MLIWHGDTSKLSGPWFALELASDGAADSSREELVLGIARWAAKRNKPLQLVFPVCKREIDGVTLLSPYLWIRGQHISGISEVASHRRAKVDFLRDVEGTPVPIEDSFVQEVIRQCRAASDSWSAGLQVGNYARILYGSHRMLCGQVRRIVNDLADLDVSIRVRTLRVSVPISCLENLGQVPREYFYTGN